MLESYRDTILSTTVEGWDEMDESDKIINGKINNHFCGLHMLVNLAELCNAVLKEFEQTQTEQADVDKSSGAVLFALCLQGL